MMMMIQQTAGHVLVEGVWRGEGHWQAVHPRRKQATAASCHVAFVAQWKIRTASLGAPGRTSLSHHVWSESLTWSFFSLSVVTASPSERMKVCEWLRILTSLEKLKSTSQIQSFICCQNYCQFWHFFVFQGVHVFRQQHKTFHTNQNHNYWMRWVKMKDMRKQTLRQ